MHRYRRAEIGRALRGALAGRQLHLLYEQVVRLPRGPTVGVQGLVCCGLLDGREEG